MVELTGLLRESVGRRRPDRRPAQDLAEGHAGHRPPGTPAPRRATVPVRGGRRLALPDLRHQHPARRPRPPVGKLGQLAYLEARHRAHARVEDAIRNAKNTGLGHLPSKHHRLNQAWCLAAAIAADLLAWLRLLCLTGDLAKAEPKTLRYRLLHTAARIIRGQRRRKIRIPDDLALGRRTRHRPHHSAHAADADLNQPSSARRRPEEPPGPWNRRPPARQPGHPHAPHHQNRR